MVPVISFVGNSNCGKTTYLEKLIKEIKAQGYKVGIVKHDVHGFDIDRPGKDTWRHSQAGADTVCISSFNKFAVIKKVSAELPLEEVLQYIKDVDLILTEGYKKAGKNKVELFRQDLPFSPVCDKAELLAVISDYDIYPDIPSFPLANAKPLAKFLIENFLLKPV